MKRLIYLILFIPAVCLGQTLGNSDNGFSTTLGRGVGFESVGGISWAEKMLTSYMNINNHLTFTQAQKDTILACFNIKSVQDTFNVKYKKTTCDFFLFFENSNKTTALATRTNTKTGKTLRWTFGRKTYDKWDQNNLPADTCKNGWLFVTSVDGFSGWTLFDINTNNFTLCPAIHWATPVYIYVHINSLTTFKTYNTWTNLQRLYFHTNTGMNANVPGYSTWTSLQYSFWYSNSMIGAIPVIGQNAAVTLYYRMQANDFTSSSLTSFRKGLIELNLQANDFVTAQVNALLLAMDTWYVGANLMTQNCTVTLDGTGMGSPTGGASNANILSLLAKASGQGKLWSFVIN